MIIANDMFLSDTILYLFKISFIFRDFRAVLVIREAVGSLPVNELGEDY
jgi:hypothetical protein